MTAALPNQFDRDLRRWEITVHEQGHFRQTLGQANCSTPSDWSPAAKSKYRAKSIQRVPSPARKSHSLKRLLSVVKFRLAASVHIAA
jgi:hypothetical protein